MTILKALFLKGVGLEVFWDAVVYLSLFARHCVSGWRCSKMNQKVA